jgi:hypothetical protein
MQQGFFMENEKEYAYGVRFVHLGEWKRPLEVGFIPDYATQKSEKVLKMSKDVAGQSSEHPGNEALRKV